MISPETFYNLLLEKNIDFFAGVPDSLLKSFCAYVDDYGEEKKHVITANEGNAVAMAAGYHLATGKVGAVYMQNSGLGNTINPLSSLCDSEVYKIPMLLIIGWRGEPGIKDEPQHVKQGKITEEQLKILDIPYHILDSETNLNTTINNIIFDIKKNGSPVALLVRKNTFSPYKSKKSSTYSAQMMREDALREILALASSDDVVVSTTGKTSRELFELRVERNEKQRDFLTVGAMGHTSSIALGVAIGQPKKRVICVDGDGSALMHLGALPIIASLKPKNLIHVLLNNSAHESVGGQPTVAGQIDMKSLAIACGYRKYYLAEDRDKLKKCFGEINNENGPVFFEIRISTGSRDDLSRPTSTPIENKAAFMEALSE